MNNDLTSLIIEHEGLELKPYKCPAGKLTIGVGRNIEENGISEEEAMILLHNDIKRVRDELEQYLWFVNLSYPRQCAMIDMCFNLGLPTFLKFKNMIAAIKARDFDRAADEMLDSLWADQVGRRAVRLADIMRAGKL